MLSSQNPLLISFSTHLYFFQDKLKHSLKGMPKKSIPSDRKKEQGMSIQVFKTLKILTSNSGTHFYSLDKKKKKEIFKDFLRIFYS